MAEGKAVIDRFEGDKAVLILDKDGQIVIDKKYLPPEAKEGDVIIFNFSLDARESGKRNKTVKNFLQKILTKQNDKLKREV